MAWDYTVPAAVGMAVLFMVVLLDMLARTFSLQHLSMWVKSEYAQVAVTFLIVGSVVVMETAGNSILTTIAAQVGAASGNLALTQATAANLGQPFEIGKAYLQTVISCQARWYYKLFVLNLFVEPISTISFEGARSVEIVGGGFFIGWLTSLIKYLGSAIVQLAIFEYIQYFLLTFAQYSMISVFLPVGLILRAFPLTRGAGGLITAFALGFAFVFPATYIAVVAMMPSLGYACNEVVLPISENTDNCYFNDGQLENGYLELKAKSGQINKTVDDIRGRLSLMYLQAFLYPMVTLIVTFTFIRQTGSLFGADLAEIGRGLIKII
jgi:hypothetical protein